MLLYHQRKNIRQKIQQTFNFNYMNVHRYNQHKWNLFGI